MTSRHLLLLIYLWAACCAGASGTGSLFSLGYGYEACTAQGTCTQGLDPTADFLQCVGLPASDTGTDHMLRLKGIIEATLDVYTFMRSRVKGVPSLTLEGAVEHGPGVDPFQNQAVVQAWLEVTLRPLLGSIDRGFLTCLSTRNFSCDTYQAVVREVSGHFSEMDPDRQKWIYSFFMYPFLSADGVSGCVRPNESSEDWLMKNFGSFRALARMNDFSTLNVIFSGLGVLHLLSPEQKAELLLRPEVAGLDNGTLSLVFHSLAGVPSTTPGGGGQNGTTPGYPYSYSSGSAYDPYLPTSTQGSIRQAMNGFIGAIQPISNLVKEFVSLTRRTDVSEIRSATLAQVLLNWTLSELAGLYTPPAVPQTQFDVADVEGWYLQVVMPLLRSFLPQEAYVGENVKRSFYNVFYLDNNMDGNNTSELQDACSISIDQNACGLTNAVENMAGVLRCAASSNLTMDEPTVMRLVVELTKRFNLLVHEFSRANFSEVVMQYREMFRQVDAPSLTPDNLADPAFILVWFQVKLLPFLPAVPPRLLSCLSAKNFTCPVYQTIVAKLSQSMRNLDPYKQFGPDIYYNFIYPLMKNRNSSDPRCRSSANSSAEWLEKNFGLFSTFASIMDFYTLNPDFSGLEALPLLTPEQIAELLGLPLPTPPSKEVVINTVFNFLVESPTERRFPEVLQFFVIFAREANLSCDIFTLVLDNLNAALPYLPRAMEPFTWNTIEVLIRLAPKGCLPLNILCPVTGYNASITCSGINSTDLQQYLSTSNSVDVPCNFTLEQYACAQLETFTASQLVSLLKCNLPDNSGLSRVTWMMLLSELSNILYPALDMLANMSTAAVIPSAPEVLDVVAEMSVFLLSGDQLKDNTTLDLWFNQRLLLFLPSASELFLRCLSAKNLSCLSYQHILSAFGHEFDQMTVRQQHSVLSEFILPFLTRLPAGSACVPTSNSSGDWLMKNFGPFSALVSVRELLQLYPAFSPLETLPLLTPKQIAELMVLPPPEKDSLINTVFDFLTVPLDVIGFPQFLSYLVMFSEKGNISCSSYKTIFNRLDQVTISAPLDITLNIIYAKVALSANIPPGCNIYNGECMVTTVNETDICAGVNNTALQCLLNSKQINGSYCDFGIEQFACVSQYTWTVADLTAVLMCNRTSSSCGTVPEWELFFSKSSAVLPPALDIISDMPFDPSDPALTLILDALQGVQLNTFSTADYQSADFIQLWFNQRLHPFLPAVSADFLSCLSIVNFTCASYQQLVMILSSQQAEMSLSTQMLVYTHFLKVYLTRSDTADPGCVANTSNTGVWLKENLGGFSVLLSYYEMIALIPSLSLMQALPLLTLRQLAEASSTPGQLTSTDQVATVMKYVPDQQLPSFFDDFSPAIAGHEGEFPAVVRSAMLQVVFNRANLSNLVAVSDGQAQTWLTKRLPPLLMDLAPLYVAPYFAVVAGRNCSTQQLAVSVLNATMSTLSSKTQQEVQYYIVQSLRGPTPLRCYGNDFNRDFYVFLESTFLGFQFPNLTTVLSLMPYSETSQLVNSMPPSSLGNLLRRPAVVDSNAALCQLYASYAQILPFLKTETLPAAVQRPTLPCVLPMALSSSTGSEVSAWFNLALPSYLQFLTKSLLTSAVTPNATCPAFQQLISTLGTYNYSSVDFVKQDVYNIIRLYLASATEPKCYNASNPQLNSTAWFAEYIGPFISFLTLADLDTFGSAQVLQVFTVNPQNIALFSNLVLPLNFTNYYTQLVYLQNSNFNPLLLPLQFQCAAPGPAFSQLTQQQSIIILYNLTTACPGLDPQISAALAGTFRDNITATSIAALGSQSTSLSTGQIGAARPQDLFASLGILGSATGWYQDQAKTITQSIMSAGLLQVTSASSLLQLGSLVVGLPSSTFSSISGSQLMVASQSPAFMTNIMAAPTLLQQTMVTQIISVNSNSQAVIQNVPDAMATQIPLFLLQGFDSSSPTDVQNLNRKTWVPAQAALFFDTVANGIGDPNNMSSNTLQGFTCTRVAAMARSQIKGLVKSCRRSGRQKVVLQETQLTCMYNYIRNEPDATSFNLYPPDMMLYYDYSMVPQASCRSYFQQLSTADYSVFSSVLNYKLTVLFANAKNCLGISGTNLTQDNIAVLGTMCCTLGGVYIQSSNASILEQLKSCPDFTSDQVAAMETLLFRGATPYGAPSTWNGQTLINLGILPLYLSQTFYRQFDKNTKQIFLQSFLKFLHANGMPRAKISNMKQAIRRSLTPSVSKRAVSNGCTVGVITQVTISDETFPFNYNDIGQFNSCLSAQVVTDNLAAIVSKVDQQDYYRVVLDKLIEAYGSVIPEVKVEVLGPASRVATINDITIWTITKIDTLSALMQPGDGAWPPGLANAIISKYLSRAGNKLGSADLNAIGGANMCSLNASVLATITPSVLSSSMASAVNVSGCSPDKQVVLFNIASAAFATRARAAAAATSLTSYQLTRPYLGGANLAYIQALSASNISMDMATFTSLNDSVVLALSVPQVRGLLGANLPQLAAYQNQSLVTRWISRQPQTQLDTLGLGLTGGRADPVTTTTTTTTTVSTVSTATTKTTPSKGHGGVPVSPNISLSFFGFLLLFVISQHILQ